VLSWIQEKYSQNETSSDTCAAQLNRIHAKRAGLRLFKKKPVARKHHRSIDAIRLQNGILLPMSQLN
jgi:hypothetical protein